MEREVMKTILAHMNYSFSEIEWDFEQLTIREKCLIKNQELLDKIKQEVSNHLGAKS